MSPVVKQLQPYLKLRVFLNLFFALIIVYFSAQYYSIRWAYITLSSTPTEEVIQKGKPTLVVVEFLQYGCEYCKMIRPAVENAIANDNDLVYMPMPIDLGNETALNIAALAYAAGQQGKFLDAHQYLINYPNVEDPELPAKLAKSLGINEARLLKDQQSLEVRSIVKNNQTVANSLSIRGVGMLLINGQGTYYAPHDPDITDQELISYFNRVRSYYVATNS